MDVGVLDQSRAAKCC